MNIKKSLGTLTLAFLGSSNALALTTYNIDIIGLYGEEYPGGPRYSGHGLGFMNDSGQIAGSTSLNYGAMGQTAWVYDGNATQILGYYDSLHTREDGYHRSFVYGISVNGMVAGRSEQYSGSSVVGYTAWISENGNTRTIGLVDPLVSGDPLSAPTTNDIVGMNDHGDVFGEAHGGGIDSAWIYQNNVTQRIGLTDDTHTNLVTGNQYSSLELFNQSGQAAGYSQRHHLYVNEGYDPFSSPAGQSAWLFNGQETIELGFTTGDYLRNGISANSTLALLNNSGQVTGYSTRYSGNSIVENTAWLYNGEETLRLGILSADYQAADGSYDAFIRSMNDAGQVIGQSRRHAGWQGYMAWVSDGYTTTELSLHGARYEIDGVVAYSDANFINQAGHVVGRNGTYSEGVNTNVFSSPEGYSTWIFKDGVVQRIGLFDDLHQGNSADHLSSVVDLNEQGQVIGTSRHYVRSSTHGGFGNSAWFFDGDETIQIGLLSGAYVNSWGQFSTSPEQLNENGQVAGESQRYSNTDSSNGSIAWLYDYGLDTTFEMLFSERSDGYAYSDVGYLSENGTLLGRYRLFDENDNYSYHLYRFDSEDGFFDLGQLIADQEEAINWTSLYAMYLNNEAGFISGYGIYADMGSVAFVMEPAPVPVPAAIWLFGSGLFGLLLIGRTRRHVQ